ncbi:Ig-like domain-containing protein [Eudoraea adriatica]|uniref:Ig-like domain-containing protein n=1 Tax=Eudoraea adriatica TaxID=446681 RepID=UPI00036F2856|nr:Ig-like domain-containing protein [Eudoraea adriatica]
MKLNTPIPPSMLCLFFSIITLFSCSKDSDLMADYVSLDPEVLIGKYVRSDVYQISIVSNSEEDGFEITVNDVSSENSGSAGTTVNDDYQVSSSASIVLDVLANDTFIDLENVSIIDTSQPDNGEVLINSDNTLTYTPSSIETSVNTFTYTVEFVNADGTVGSETATVTININPTSSLKLSGPNIFYVTVNGSSGNDGSSEAGAWDIQHAFKTAKAGDFVYVKAGNYGNINLNTVAAGTSGSPISIIGYKDIPGDIVANNGTTFTYADYQANGNLLDSTEYPLLVGTRTNNAAAFQSAGITINHANWTIQNFGFMYFDYGILINAGGKYTTIDNLIGAWMGDFNPANSWNPTAPAANANYTPPLPAGGTSTSFVNLRGQALSSHADYVTITNSICINGGARGFSLQFSDFYTVDNVAAYSDQNVNPTDYYIMAYDVQNSIFTNLTVKRLGNLTHQGHGISLKNNSNYNSYNNLEIYNCDLELNISCTNNSFQNFTITGGSDGGKRGGIILSSGSNHNVFQNGSLIGTEGIRFWDASEPEGVGTIINDTGDYNTFTNIVVRNSSYDNQAPIAFHWILQNKITSTVDHNEFYNCTFDGSNYVFMVDRVNSGTKFIDCSFVNISKGLRSSKYSTNAAIPLDVTFTNCTWENVNFTPPNN